MCGIAGLVARKPLGPDDFRKFLEVWSEQELRGVQASGIIIYFSDGRILFSKMPIPAGEHAKVISRLTLPYARITMILAHAREATSGTPFNNENNHPLYHYLNGRLISLVHNGIIYAQYSRVRKVDSDALFYYIRKNNSFDDKTMVQTFNEVDGFRAVIVGDGNVMYFFRDINPLEYVENDRFIVLASDYLDQVFTDVKPIPAKPYMLYKVEDGMIREVQEITNHYYDYYGRYIGFYT
mgnify:FL=1